MKRNETIVKEINEMFPPADEKYPVCFVREGEDRVIVSGECHAKVKICGEIFNTAVIDYYGEYRGGSLWIDPKLVAYAAKMNAFWEWECPACIFLVKNL